MHNNGYVGKGCHFMSLLISVKKIGLIIVQVSYGEVLGDKSAVVLRELSNAIDHSR